MNKRQLLITVGTTKFEQLIKSIDKDSFYQLLIDNKFTDLIIQKGIGEYIPTACDKFKEKMNIRIEVFLAHFDDVIKDSEIVISHGGAGSILESLKNKKKVIVCVNDLLMDNHQTELAISLDNEQYVHYGKDLAVIISDLQMIIEGKKVLKKYPECNYDAIPNLIYEMLDI